MTSGLLLIAACLFFWHCCCPQVAPPLSHSPGPALVFCATYCATSQWFCARRLLPGCNFPGSGWPPTCEQENIPWKIIHEGIRQVGIHEGQITVWSISEPSIHPKKLAQFFFSNFPTIRIPMDFSVKDLHFLGSGRPGQLGGHYAAWSLALLLAYGSAVGSTKVNKMAGFTVSPSTIGIFWGGFNRDIIWS